MEANKEDPCGNTYALVFRVYSYVRAGSGEKVSLASRFPAKAFSIWEREEYSRASTGKALGSKGFRFGRGGTHVGCAFSHPRALSSIYTPVVQTIRYREKATRVELFPSSKILFGCLAKAGRDARAILVIIIGSPLILRQPFYMVARPFLVK